MPPPSQVTQHTRVSADHFHLPSCAIRLQQAIGLGLLSAHAHEAWLLIYGREDVSMNQERAFQLAEEGVRLGCYHCQGVLAYCYWGGYGCDANETRSLELAIESSNKGSKYGQLSLGILRQDNKLCVLAASQGLDEAQYRFRVQGIHGLAFRMTFFQNWNYPIQ